MNRTARPVMELHIDADSRFIYTVVSFAEHAALALGLTRLDADKLKLAAEEIFSYLSHTAAPRREMQIKIRGASHYIDMQFCFEPDDFNMKAFNFTFKPPQAGDSIPRETGLLIATRVVDSIRFSQSGRRLFLTMRKEKSYLPAGKASLPEIRQLQNIDVRPPDESELTLIVHRARDFYTPDRLPPFFFHSGKVGDMILSGELHAVIAADRTGAVGGALFWDTESPPLSECYGPYIFNQQKSSDIAGALVEGCLKALARTTITGLISVYGTDELPLEYFERLGSLTLKLPSGDIITRNAFYREIKEDEVLTVWSHPLLESFLARQYHDLVFTRDIRLLGHHAGSAGSRDAVIWAENNRGRHLVILHPVWWGGDAHETLSEFVQILGREKISNLLFTMDLGHHWHCNFTPALLDNGFEPRFIIPHAGKSDIVIFQHREE